MMKDSIRDIWIRMDCPSTFSILDVGCNEGNLTAEMLRLAKEQLPGVACSAVGIDLDEVLIERAKEKFKDECDMNFCVVDCMRPGAVDECLQSLQVVSFSLVCAFSITMWIHMNHSDEGLLFFLKMLYQVCAGAVLVEPQKWKSYRNAMQRCRRRGIQVLPHYQDLAITDVEGECTRMYVEECGMKLGWTATSEGWGRELLLFCKHSSRTTGSEKISS